MSKWFASKTCGRHKGYQLPVTRPNRRTHPALALPGSKLVTILDSQGVLNAWSLRTCGCAIDQFARRGKQSDAFEWSSLGFSIAFSVSDSIAAAYGAGGAAGAGSGFVREFRAKTNREGWSAARSHGAFSTGSRIAAGLHQEHPAIARHTYAISFPPPEHESRFFRGSSLQSTQSFTGLFQFWPD